ncbi:MAG: hypothetical protein ACTHM5_16165 [Ginsengibacter sp.]
MRRFYLLIFIVFGFIVKVNGQSLSASALPDFGNVCVGSDVGPNSFTISGSSLTTANISVGPLNGFTFSISSGGPYSPSLSLSQVGETYSQDIYVKFTPAAAQSYNGNIPVSGGGAASINVAATGSGSANQPVSVSIGASSTICAGPSVTFTATPTNGGSLPSYQWKLNGLNVGTNSNSYSATGLTDGNVVSVVMTSNATCATGNPATNSITVNENPTANAGGALPAICQGASSAQMGGSVGGGATGGTWSGGAGTWTNANNPATATYKASATESGTITLTLTTTGGSCGTTTAIKTITVNPTLVPSVSITSTSTSICSGTSVTFTATPTNGGSAPTYQWKVNGSNVGTNSATYTTAGLTNGQTVTVILTSNAPCTTPINVTSNGISMSVYSGAPSVGNGNGSQPTGLQSICPGPAATGIIYTAPVQSTNAQYYIWNLPPGFVITSGDSTSQITVSVPGPGAVFANNQPLTVTLVNPCGRVTSGNIGKGNPLGVNVNKFNAVDAGSNFSMCSGTSQNLTNVISGAASKVYWTASSGTITGGPYPAQFVYTPSLTSGTATLTVVTDTASGSCNTSASFGMEQITVTINQPSSAPTSLSSPVTICRGSSTTLTQSGGVLGTGAVWKWYTNSGYTIVAPGTVAADGSLTVSPTVTTTYYLRAETPTNGPCGQYVAGGNVTITVSQPSAAPTSLSSSVTICSGSSTTLSQTGGVLGTGASWKWYTDAAYNNLAPGTVAANGSLSVSPTTTTTYYLRAESTTGSPCAANVAATGSVTVTVNQSSSAPTSLSSPVTICNGSSTTLTQSGGVLGTGAVWKWYTNSTYTNLAPGTVAADGSLTVSPTVTTTYYLRAETPTNGPCSQYVAGGNVTITVSQPSVAPTSLSSSVTICSGSSTTLSQTGGVLGTGASWKWYTDAAYNNLAPGTVAANGSLSVSPTATTTYYLRAESTTGSPCAANVAATGSVTVTVNQSSSAPTSLSSPVTICSGSSTTLTQTGGVLGTGAVWKWYTNSSYTTSAPGTVAADGSLTVSPTVTTTYYLRAESTTGAPCVANLNAGTIKVTVNDPISITTQPSPSQTVCLSFPATFSVEASGTGLTYQWYLGPNPINGATSSTYNIAKAQQSDAGTYTVVVSGAGNICTAQTSEAAELVVNQTITATVTPASQTQCEGSAATFTVSTTGTVNTYQWRRNGNSIFDGGNISGTNTATLTVTGLTPGDAGNYDVVVSGPAGQCSQVISNVTNLTVTPTVTIAPFNPAASTRCQEAGTVTYTTTATNATSLVYNLDATTAAFAGNSINSSTGAVTYAAGWSGATTITASAEGCNGPATTTLTVTTTPTVTIAAFTPATLTRCQGAAIITTATTASNNSSAIVYSLDATTAAFAGNSINSSTGAVTYAAGWSGTTTITASAAGCNGPATTTLTVTTTPTVTIAGFTPATSTRCQGAGVVSYTTTASNYTSLVYSLDPATAGFAGNSINSSTGAVTYAAGWNGTTTITATAQGCNGPVTATHIVTISPLSSGGTISPTQILCSGTAPANITLSGQTGNVVEWQSSSTPDFSTPITHYAVSGTTLPGGTIGVLTSTIYVRAVVQSGTCSQVFSPVIVIAVNPPFVPVITALPSTTICLGQTVTLVSGGFNTRDTIMGGDFGQANPPGWSGNNAGNNNGGANNIWGETNPGKQYGDSIYSNTAGDKFMIVNGVPAPTTFLSTPTFSSVGRTSLSLQWQQGYNFNGSATGSVQISIDGGTTWITLQTYNSSSPKVRTNPFNSIQTIDLNAYLGQPNMKIRFFYTGTPGSAWAIDNVNVLGPYQPITYTWPAGFTPSADGSSATGAPTDTTTYTIKTSTGECAETSTTITINVNKPPVITAQPSVTAATCVGGSASISVTVTGTALTYQWQVSTDGGTNWTNITGAPYTGFNTNALNVAATTSNIAGNLYHVIVTAPSPCNISVTSEAAALQIKNIWTGTIDTDWNTPGNWSDGSVPGISCPVVTIPVVTSNNYPILSTGAMATIISLQIDANASAKITGNTMQLAGSITNNGIFDVMNGTLEFNGLSAQTIAGSMFKDNAIGNLTLSNTAGLTFTGTNDLVNILGTVSFGKTSGTIITNDNMVLKSSKDSTASVGFMNLGNDITGNVSVERYINTGDGGHAKTWQMLGVPTHGNQSIRDSWMEGATASNVTLHAEGSAGNPKAGYGTMTTSNVANAANFLIPGFDAHTTPGPSIKSYDWSTNSYVGPSSTAVPVYNQKGWMVLVRGDRSVYAYNQPANATILRTKGPLFTAKVPPPGSIVKAGNFEAVGNPYASAIDIRKLDWDENTPEFVIVWDPKLGGVYGLGAFQTLFLSDDGNYYAVPGSGSYGSKPKPANYLQSGQAFFIQAADNVDGSVSFEESSKASVSNAGVMYFRNKNMASPTVKNPQLRATMFGVSTNGSAFVTDGNLIQYSNAYSNKIDGMDARKLINSSENFEIISGGKILGIERRSPIVNADTIFYNLTGLVAQHYRMEFTATGLSAYGVEGFVEDSYLNTRTPMNMEGTTNVDFAVTSDKGSYAANRFRIVFKTAVVLPVKLISVAAVQQDENIRVDWKVENEKAVKQYVVEKATDGVIFKQAGIVAAANNEAGSSYQWLDDKAIPGDNYYRIRIEEQTGKISYSDVVKVSIPLGKPSIGIYPNPITDGIIHLQLINQPKGRYGLRLLNPLGQAIIAKQVEHAGGNATEDIKWDYHLAHGVYQLQVLKPDGKISVIKVMY